MFPCTVLFGTTLTRREGADKAMDTADMTLKKEKGAMTFDLSPRLSFAGPTGRRPEMGEEN
ncbi:hypothetical protein GCM10011273_21840 [Asticcacaulis endophyticus]|uniref:Uncharacterized protein n=1 Tax=Asticcacaulis endophyticus TaxID=1395890 RepID=A0A918Q6X6_9CAUL|nr:hypothetical protein GCM10011273_21840 [Asticcacaulis endophyticus]